MASDFQSCSGLARHPGSGPCRFGFGALGLGRRFEHSHRPPSPSGNSGPPPLHPRARAHRPHAGPRAVLLRDCAAHHLLGRFHRPWHRPWASHGRPALDIGWRCRGTRTTADGAPGAAYRHRGGARRRLRRARNRHWTAGVLAIDGGADCLLAALWRPAGTLEPHGCTRPRPRRCHRDAPRHARHDSRQRGRRRAGRPQRPLDLCGGAWRSPTGGG